MLNGSPGEDVSQSNSFSQRTKKIHLDTETDKKNADGNCLQCVCVCLHYTAEIKVDLQTHTHAHTHTKRGIIVYQAE